MRAKLVLLAKPNSVADVREWVVDKCSCFGVKGYRLNYIRIITSEIVTNVIKHAYRPGQKKKLTLTVKLKLDKLTIIARDHGSGFRASRSRTLHVGLLIVKSLADKVKIRSFGFGSQIKVIIFLNSSEIKKPLVSRFNLIKHGL